MDIRPIDANTLEDLFHKQIEYGATDFFKAFEDALQDTPLLRCEECPNYEAAFDCRSSCPNCERTLSLNTLRDAIYRDAVEHGLWEEHDKVCPELSTKLCDLNFDQVRRIDCASYIDGECEELFDAIYNANAYAEELADVIIMSMSVAGKLGIDIDAAIRRKMEINKKRPWKHGKTD